MKKFLMASDLGDLGKAVEEALEVKKIGTRISTWERIKPFMRIFQ